MPVFQYRAVQSDGGITEGQIEDTGRQEAFRQMEGRGLRPISLSEHANGKNGKSGKNGRSGKAEAAPSGSGEPGTTIASMKVSFPGSNKINARTLENFTR